MRISGRLSVLSLLVLGSAFSVSCGGGGGSSFTAGGGSSSGSSSTLTITTPSILPATVRGQSYSTTLQATGGNGALRWSIAPISPTTLFVDGLSINTNTGTLTGTVNFLGTAGMSATVTDGSLSATKIFTITAGMNLTPGPDISLNVGLYEPPSSRSLGIQGGATPLTYTLTQGTLPPGMRLNSANGSIDGSPYVPGSYHATVTVQDSLSPPEVVSKQVNITTVAPSLDLNLYLESVIPLNAPISRTISILGGTPPYTISTANVSLPAGMTFDTSSGRLSGTPTVSGGYGFTVLVADSSSPQQRAARFFNFSVRPALGRNDKPASATRIYGNISASISPYIDPPGTPYAADNDYYKIVAMPGSIVHVETFAKRNNSSNPLDTVLEILDVNGGTVSTCALPGVVTPTYTSICLNDDISATPHVQDSSLDLQVPPGAAKPATYLIHVFDWAGQARPDMVYELRLTGAVQPLLMNTTSLANAIRNRSYTQSIATSGVAPITLTLASGSLPPGLSLASGSITGTPTTDGTFAFSLSATDAAGQVVTSSFQIQVGEPVSIISPAIWPDACVNRPYSFTLQTSNGVTPFTWGFTSFNWVAINLNQATGTFSGTASVLGTFTGTVSVTDSAGSGASQQVTLHVVNCP